MLAHDLGELLGRHAGVDLLPAMPPMSGVPMTLSTGTRRGDLEVRRDDAI